MVEAKKAGTDALSAGKLEEAVRLYSEVRCRAAPSLFFRGTAGSHRSALVLAAIGAAA